MKVEYQELGQHGRLGNMLWQIAGTVGIAHALGVDPQIDPAWTYRPYFSLPDEWYGNDPSESVSNHVEGNRWRVRYMQDPALWWDLADEIAWVFAPSARARAVLDALPQPGPMDVAVHVRRTDYLTMPDHLPVLPAHWYRRAVGPLTTLLGWKHAHDLRLHVYGDDPEWAEAELLPTTAHRNDPVWSLRGYGSEEADEITDWCDLQMMARYRNLVIANSSYSWWAAFLAGPEATVCYPSPWFGPKIDVASPALPEWIEVAA